MTVSLRKLLGISIVTAVLALLFVGCGGDDDDDAGTTATTATAAAAGTTVAAATEAPMDPGGTLIVGVPNDCGSPDFTSQAGAGGGQWVCNGLVRDALIGRDPETFELVPYLAESYEISADGMTRTFVIRQGIFFTNGEPLNAEAVAFSYDRQLNRTPEQGGLADYPGAEDFRGTAKASFTARLDDDEPYTILDEYTIRVNFKRLDVTRTASINPVPPGYIREVGDAEYARHPISTGPYIFVDRTPGAEMVFTRNDDYWNKDNAVPSGHIWAAQWKDIIHKVIPEEQTRISALITGEVDMITSVSPVAVPRLENDSNVNVVFINGTQTIEIIIASCPEFHPDTGAPNPFRDVRVRQAMNYAVDVDGIINNIMTGQEIRHASVPPLDPYIDYDRLPMYGYDVDKAKELMAEAGYADGLPGTYDIWNPTGRWTASGDVVAVVAEYLRAIGIDAQIRPAEYLTVTTGIQDNTIWPMSFWGTYSTPDGTIAGILTPQGDGCMGRWNLFVEDQEIAEIAQKAGETVDLFERGKILTEAYRLWGERAYDIPMYSNVVVHALSVDLGWEPTRRASTNTYQPALIKAQ